MSGSVRGRTRPDMSRTSNRTPNPIRVGCPLSGFCPCRLKTARVGVAGGARSTRATSRCCAARACHGPQDIWPGGAPNGRGVGVSGPLSNPVELPHRGSRAKIFLSPRDLVFNLISAEINPVRAPVGWKEHSNGHSALAAYYFL
jgi:hypothetical protein